MSARHAIHPASRHQLRNFRQLDVRLERRTFLVGPNASGKSNVLDALRFLRDVADSGGLQRAVGSEGQGRGGVSQIRSLHARKSPNVVLEVDLDLGKPWRYRLEFGQDNLRRPVVRREEVWAGEESVLKRPDSDDLQDPDRLSRTHLEQVNSNKRFREVASFLAQVRYLHLVPQLVREPDRPMDRPRDPYGRDFLDQLAQWERTNARVFQSRLGRIRDALQVAVPQLKELELERDVHGVPHLRGRYEHWRPNAGWQNEGQFSDGTLRLLGLLWALLDGNGPLLLEEPELSLHGAVVRFIPGMMWRLGRKAGRQVVVTTHSADLLSDESIAPEEVLLLEPSREGTRIVSAASIPQIRQLLGGGLPLGEAILPRAAPSNADQLALFGD